MPISVKGKPHKFKLTITEQARVVTQMAKVNACQTVLIREIFGTQPYLEGFLNGSRQISVSDFGKFCRLINAKMGDILDIQVRA